MDLHTAITQMRGKTIGAQFHADGAGLESDGGMMDTKLVDAIRAFRDVALTRRRVEEELADAERRVSELTAAVGEARARYDAARMALVCAAAGDDMPLVDGRWPVKGRGVDD